MKNDLKSRKMTYLKLLSILLAISAFSMPCLHAQILVGYNFAGDALSTTASVNTLDGSAVDSGLATATVVSRGSGTGSSITPGGFNTVNGMSFEYHGNYPTTVPAAITAGTYLQFSVSSSSAPLNLTTLNFGVGSQDGVGTLALAYSINGGAFVTTGIDGGDNGIPSSEYTLSGTGNGQTVGGVNNPNLVSVDLSQITALQNVTGTVTFDLITLDDNGFKTVDFERGNTATAGTQDDIELLGIAAAVPEPSTYALMLGSLVALFFLNRRRSRN